MPRWLPPRDILKHISAPGTEFMPLILYNKRNNNNTIPQFLKTTKLQDTILETLHIVNNVSFLNVLLFVRYCFLL